VTRTADALDPKTHTLRTEVQVPNPDNALWPGVSLRVKLALDRGAPSVHIPAAAVVVRGGRRAVAVLDPGTPSATGTCGSGGTWAARSRCSPGSRPAIGWSSTPACS
jgi:multidrug efflux pump subunit AcrA (membrane-fusion protein)